jgi:hypothetical protein
VTNRNHIQIQTQIALLCIVLLIGRFGVLIHSVEHPFHLSEQSCEVFLALEQSANGLFSDVFQLPILTIHDPVISVIVEFFSRVQTAYRTRAPPFLL